METADKGPNTSASLLIRIRDSSDKESWGVFEEIYAPIVRAYCRRRGFQNSDVEDITQEVMVKVCQSIRKFEYDPAIGKFRSWLATITANQLKSFVRNRDINDSHLVNAVESFHKAPGSESQWTTIFIQNLFETACGRIRNEFEERTWQCFEETWVHHKAPNVVADQLEIAVHSVYVNKSRVLKRLEQEFEFLTHDLPFAEI